MDAPSASELSRLEAMLVAGEYEEAKPLARRLVSRYPKHPAGWDALSGILARSGDIQGALTSMERAERLAPTDLRVLIHAGQVCELAGRPDGAERRYRAATTLAPNIAAVRNRLGEFIGRQGRFEEAARYFREALNGYPTDAQAWFNLGGVLGMLRRPRESGVCLRRCIELRPDHANAHALLGSSLSQQGRADEAELCYRDALRIAPTWSPRWHSDLLMCMNYADVSVDRYLSEAHRYGAAASRAAAPTQFHAWRTAVGEARMRVGIVSGNLRAHAESFFLESLLRHIDRSRIALYAYPQVTVRDETTARIQQQFEGWKPINALTDADAANLIHSDGIQVLVDLSGHTDGSRSSLFAHRPAPVQVSWLGYFASTGIAEMDWFIADPVSVPPEHEPQFTERIWRLCDTRLCYTPPEVPIEPGQLPALERGFVTFCCFNSLAKLNDRVIGAMARVLTGVPSSRLLLKAMQLGEESAQEDLHQRFGEHGIAADRLILEAPSPRAEYLAAYRRADIGLDAFPFTGCTTTAESLWMGVPVVTFAGERLVSRQGACVMSSAGLSDWVAPDLDGYVDMAIRRAGDLPALATLRARLRRDVLASPLCDAARFARQFENAVFGMLEDYRNRASASRSDHDTPG